MKRSARNFALLPLSLLALGMWSCVAAAPPSQRVLDERVINAPRPDITILSSPCAHPFEDRGTYQIPAGYSGAGTSTRAIPAGKFLQVRTVNITLAESDWRGAHLGVWTHGDFAWYPLRTENGSAVFRVKDDGPLYADGGGQTFKFVSYRAQGYDRPASGTYVVRGCLLDRIPIWVTKPDIRVPRYPKKVLTPVEPVELWDGVRRPMQQPTR
jgi:hypothetical protein